MIFQIIKTTDSRFNGVFITKDTLYSVGDTFSLDAINFDIIKIDTIESGVFKLISNNYQVILKLIDAN